MPGTGQGKSKAPTAKVCKQFTYYLLPNKLHLYTILTLKPCVCLFTKFCPVLSKKHHEFSDMHLLFLIFKKHRLKTLLTFNDSPHDGLQQGFSGSMVTGSTCFWNSRRQQSMILIIRWGGFASFLTVAISTGLMVYLKKNVTESCINTIILFSHSVSWF